MRQTQFDRSSEIWDEEGKKKLKFELVTWDKMTGFKVKVIKQGFETVEEGILWYVGKEDVTMSPQNYLNWKEGNIELGVFWSGTGRTEFVKLSEIHWCLYKNHTIVWSKDATKKGKQKAVLRM